VDAVSIRFKLGPAPLREDARLGVLVLLPVKLRCLSSRPSCLSFRAVLSATEPILEGHTTLVWSFFLRTVILSMSGLVRRL
jgi:hypothetical protein